MGDDKSEEDNAKQLVTVAKKLYGNIQEVSVQLENLSSRCLEVEDLFSPELQAKRLVIKDCCEHLFQLSPKSYGAVAREKLWRLALYDAIHKARKIQRDRQWNPMQLGLVKAHLQGGIGVLQLYIMKLKGLSDSISEPLTLRMNGIDRWLEGPTGEGEKRILTYGEQKRTWISDLAHLCTINIGDLYRYLKEIHAKANDPDLVFEASFYVTGAQTHYAQAFLLRPDSGLAFNQLGNLYCDANGTLQSAYYLLYSVQSTNAYEGAYSNLRQLLDRKIVQFARLPASVEPKPIDTLVNSVLSLMYYFLYEHSHLPNYERHCQEALTNFNERLVTCDPEMDDKFLFHLSSICIMTVWRLQTINSVHTSAAVAFSISIFCQLVNHLTSNLEQYARLKESVSVAATPSPEPSEVEQEQDLVSDPTRTSAKNNTEDEDNDQESVVNEKDSSFEIPKRRKKKTRHRSGDVESDSELSDYETFDLINGKEEDELDYCDESTDDDWSDNGDDDCGSISDVGECSQPDGSELSFKINNQNKAFGSSSSNANSDSSGSSRRGKKGYTQQCKEMDETSNLVSRNAITDLIEEENKNSKFVIEAEDLLKCQSRTEAVLVALSPFLRWIQATSVIKDALAANAEKVFLEKLCSGLNLLLSQNWPTVLSGVSLPELAEDWNKLCQEPVTEKMIFEWELDEDRSMLGIPQLADFVNHLKLQSVTEIDALIIRMGRMVAFGSWMVSTESFSLIYSPEEMKFVVPTPQTLKAYLLGSKLKRLKNRMNDADDKLSRAYNQMKLRPNERQSSRRRRNRDRERSGRRRRNRRDHNLGFGEMPLRTSAIYCVVDLEAILRRFKDVKRIAAHRKFVIAIPSSVWKTLDMLKDSSEDDSIIARETFTWLEAAFRRNHPGLALYKEQQKQKINFPYPRDPVDVDAWEYYDMMEYCNYIAGQIKKEGAPHARGEAIWGDVRDKCKVFFLTGREDLLNTKIVRGFDPVKIARNVGIYVDYIGPYPGLGRGKKWKSVATSNG